MKIETRMNERHQIHPIHNTRHHQPSDRQRRMQMHNIIHLNQPGTEHRLQFQHQFGLIEMEMERRIRRQIILPDGQIAVQILMVKNMDGKAQNLSAQKCTIEDHHHRNRLMFCIDKCHRHTDRRINLRPRKMEEERALEEKKVKEMKLKHLTPTVGQALTLGWASQSVGGQEARNGVQPLHGGSK